MKWYLLTYLVWFRVLNFACIIWISENRAEQTSMQLNPNIDFGEWFWTNNEFSGNWKEKRKYSFFPSLMCVCWCRSLGQTLPPFPSHPSVEGVDSIFVFVVGDPFVGLEWELDCKDKTAKTPSERKRIGAPFVTSLACFIRIRPGKEEEEKFSFFLKFNWKENFIVHSRHQRRRHIRTTLISGSFIGIRFSRLSLFLNEQFVTIVKLSFEFYDLFRKWEQDDKRRRRRRRLRLLLFYSKVINQSLLHV